MIAYTAYCESVGGVHPSWNDLTPEIRRAWEAAAQAVVDHVSAI